MKTHINNYTFDHLNKQVALLDFTQIRLDGILLITNVTRNIIIYNFASGTLGGSVTGNVLTLVYDTSMMADDDKLMIFYEDDRVIPDASQIAKAIDNESNWLLRRIVKLLESNGVTDASLRQRVAVESISGSSLGRSVTGLDSGPGYPTVNVPTANAPTPSTSTTYWQPVWAGPVDSRYEYLDNARVSYSNSIRNNLIFN